jgi:hypothetical protein
MVVQFFASILVDGHPWPAKRFHDITPAILAVSAQSMRRDEIPEHKICTTSTGVTSMWFDPLSAG